MPAETMMLDYLGTTPEFDDFNFSSYWDSSMKRRISQAALVDWVIDGRALDPDSMDNLANAMYFTLRPPAFEAYQRLLGPVAISYPEWFYLKLRQFLRILLFDEVEVKTHEEIELDELTQGIAPEDNHHEVWFRLVESACYYPDNRVQGLRAWLERHRRAQGSARSRWTKNQPRGAVIRSELSRGTERMAICRMLDEAGIETTLGLQERGFARWLDAWSDPDGRQSVQTLFSKAKACQDR
jgi:hypothetical protein